MTEQERYVIFSDNLRQLCEMAQRLEEIMKDIWIRGIEKGYVYDLNNSY